MFLILHNVRSAYNVGSIFRTADAAGVEKIFLCGYTPTPATKTALGAEATVPWEHHAQTWRLLKELKRQDIHIVALEQYQYSTDLFRYTPKFPMALLVGHERKGLSKTMLHLVDDIVEIPMHGAKESLNVAVATGIAVYYLYVRPQTRSKS
ncbi:MAG: TrmH family RNA methyltransferase [Patescibacteria group bacterium]